MADPDRREGCAGSRNKKPRHCGVLCDGPVRWQQKLHAGRAHRASCFVLSLAFRPPFASRCSPAVFRYGFGQILGIAPPPSLPTANVPLCAPLTRGSTSPAASRLGYLPRCERLRCFRSPPRRVLFNDALLRRRSVFAHPSERAPCPVSEAVPFGPCLFAGATPCTGRSPLSRLALGDPDPGVGPSVHGRFASFAGPLPLRLAPSVPVPRSGVPRLDRGTHVTSVPPSHH